jgi:hypothetical protein
VGPWGGTLTIDWDNLDSLLGAMVEVGLQSKEIDTYFQQHVVNTLGLDYPSCALKPIGDVLPELGTAFKDARRYYQRRWVEVIHDPRQPCRGRAAAQAQRGLGDDLGGVRRDPRRHQRGHRLHQRPRRARGASPASAGEVPRGLHRPPLAGNYRLLGTNADSCRHTATAFRDWSLNFGRLTLTTQYCLTGSTADSFTAHVGLYGVVMRAAGEAVGQGASVFEAPPHGGDPSTTPMMA